MRIEPVHIDAERALSRHGTHGILGEIDAIRAIAAAEANHAALSILSIVDTALARGERRSLNEWVALARDAIDTGRSDAPTAQAYLAACAVRFAH